MGVAVIGNRLLFWMLYSAAIKFYVSMHIFIHIRSTDSQLSMTHAAKNRLTSPQTVTPQTLNPVSTTAALRCAALRVASDRERYVAISRAT